MYRKKEKQNTPIEKIKNYFDSYNIFSDGIDITVINDREINIDGCVGIDEYTDDLVIFAGKAMKVMVYGKDLELYTFVGGRIKASGKISRIEYERGEVLD